MGSEISKSIGILGITNVSFVATMGSVNEFCFGPYTFDNGQIVIKQFDITTNGDIKNMILLSLSVNKSVVVCDHMTITISKTQFTGVNSKQVGLLINQSSQSTLVLSDIVFNNFLQTSAA